MALSRYAVVSRCVVLLQSASNQIARDNKKLVTSLRCPIPFPKRTGSRSLSSRSIVYCEKHFWKKAYGCSHIIGVELPLRQDNLKPHGQLSQYNIRVLHTYGGLALAVAHRKRNEEIDEKKKEKVSRAPEANPLLLLIFLRALLIITR